MARVPVIDQTASGAQPFAAPNVAAMRNFAPEQIAQSGAALEQAGSVAMRTGQTIGDRIAAQVDDAKTKQAETSFLQSTQNILYDPQAGYYTKQGQAAVAAYQPTKEALNKAAQDGLAGLDNDIQKQMFRQVTQQHLVSMGGRLADYNHSQSVAWSASESKARAESYQIQAVQSLGSRYQVDEKGQPTGDFSKYVAQGEMEVKNSAALAGFDANSAQTRAMVREWHTGVNQSIISNLLDNHDAYGAKKWLDEQKAAGNIDLRNLTSLENAVKGQYDQQQVSDATSQIMAEALHTTSGGKGAPVTLAMPVPGSSINVTGQMGDPRANGRKHDGIDIAVPVGTSVMAPAAGKVVKVWNDDQFGGGLSVQVQLQDGKIAGFAHLSAANVHVGDEVPQGTQLGLSGKSGNATGPTLHYAMRDTDGKYVDPRQVSQPQPNPQGFSDPNTLSRALDILNRRDDLTSHQKMQVEAQLRTQHSAFREIENQKQTDLFKQASEYFYRGGENASAVPPSLMMQLTGEQQQQFRDKQRAKVESDYNYGQFLKTSSETDIVSDFYANPKMLTVENVEAARPQLSRSTYLQFMNRAGEQAKNPSGVVEAQNVNERIRHFAEPAGIDFHPLLPADKTKLNDLHYSVSNAIDEIKRQNNGKATAAQVDEAIKHQVIQYTTPTARTFWHPFTTSQTQYLFQGNPKIGDTRSFPNGKTGTWDGSGWVAQ